MAVAAQTHVSTTRCGHKYTPACTAPKISHKPLTTKCVRNGSGYTLPTLTFTSNAGIRKIQIREGARTLKSITFKGKGRTQYRLRGVAISTLRLSAGGHPLIVKVTDVRGRSATKRLNFSVCESTTITNQPLSAKCVSTGSGYRLPRLTFASNAGIRRIEVREGSRTIKTITFKGTAKTQYALTGLSIATLGLSSGGHQVSLRITDARGRTASKTLRFSVCVSTPVFTG